MADIRYQVYSVSELPDLAEHAAANHEVVVNVPISVERALSHSRNPAAAPDDPGLVTAWHEERCVGYLGLMPGEFWHGDRIRKVEIATTLLVDPTFRGKGIAKGILATAVGLDWDMVLTGFTPPAERLYERNPQWFERDEGVPWVRVHLVPTASAIYLLEAKWTKGKRKLALGALKRLERGAAKVGLTKLFHRATVAHPGQNFPELQARRVDRIHVFGDDEPAPKPGDPPHFVHSERHINFMLEYPWVVERPESEQKYYFSHHRELFRFVCYEFVEKASGKVVGYAVYSVTRRSGINFLKVCFHRTLDPAHAPFVFEAALMAAREYAVDIMMGPAELADWAAARPGLTPFVQRAQRGYFVFRKSEDSALAGPASDIAWTFQDGDMPFN